MKTPIIIILFFTSLTTRAQQMEAAGLLYVVNKPRVQSIKPSLLIMLHGYGSNEQDLMGLAGYLPPQFLVVSARAPITLSAGSYAWFRLDLSTGKPVYDSEEAERARQQLFLFMDEVKKKYDASEVLLLGFSQGAIMSYSVALTQPQKVKGIVALSGRVLTDIDPHLASAAQLQKLNIFIGHGTKDEVLPFYNGEAAYLKCKNLGAQVTFKEYPVGHEISGPELTHIQKWLATILSGN
ncbi:MAG: dienelactone hydrolase family protein [Bacteroidota bacterium]